LGALSGEEEGDGGVCAHGNSLASLVLRILSVDNS
jgi:hypothetical protein